MVKKATQLLCIACVCSISCGGSGPDAVAHDGRFLQHQSATIRPFSIEVPEADLVDLQQRLARARYPDELHGVGWSYGTPRAYMEELVAYWRDEFDWREQERQLNRFAQFKTNIDGLNIHFIHQRSVHNEALPVLILHGWPSSFMQFHKVIDPLVNPQNYGAAAGDAFHLVVPSIPGYGFSDQPKKPGYAAAQMGDIFIELMNRLGYDRYGVQAGDWGAPIVAHIARNNSIQVVGMHTETCRGGPPVGVADPTEGVPLAELERMRDRQAFFSDEEQGYRAIQGTKPQTLAYALNDSPLGQAAWIVEKYRAWSDISKDLESKFSKDELLTNISIYWFTQTANSSGRLYFEGNRQNLINPVSHDGRIEVPTGCAAYPKDVGFTPRLWNEAIYNVTRFTIMPRGGHFAALEEPKLYVDEVRAFFGELR